MNLSTLSSFHWSVALADGTVHRLISAEAISLAQMARAFTLAPSLDSASYEVHLVCDPRYLLLFDELAFPVHAIRSIRRDVFQSRLAHRRLLYTTTELRQYV